MGAILVNSYKNKKVFAVSNSAVNVRVGAGTTNAIQFVATKGSVIGTSTGYLLGDWVQVLPSKPRTDGKIYSYVSKNLIVLKDIPAGKTFTPPTNYNPDITIPYKENPTDEETAQLIFATIENDKILYKRLLVAWEALELLEKKGLNVEQQRRFFYTVALSLVKRQERISKLLAEKSDSKVIAMEPGKGDFSELYRKIYNKYSKAPISGLGWVWVAVGVVIVVAAIVWASISIYKSMRPEYEEGKAHLDLSKAFGDWVKTLPEDQQKTVKDDLQKQLDDAYNKGKQQQFDKDANVKYITWAVLAFLAFLGIKELSKPRNQSQPVIIQK